VAGCPGRTGRDPRTWKGWKKKLLAGLVGDGGLGVVAKGDGEAAWAGVGDGKAWKGDGEAAWAGVGDGKAWGRKVVGMGVGRVGGLVGAGVGAGVGARGVDGEEGAAGKFRGVNPAGVGEAG